MKKLLLLTILSLFYLNGFTQNDNVKLVTKGNVYIGTSSSQTKCALYIKGDYKALENTAIEQIGKTILTGNFLNDITSGHIFTANTNGSFEFQGTKIQHIKGRAKKESCFIDFPNLIINNMTIVNDASKDTAAVVIASNQGVSAKSLNMSRGRLILDSDTITTRTTDIAHLLVKENVIYPTGNDLRPRNEKGIIQIKLATGNLHNERGLIGFTPPFKKIYADYFFYNFLSRPTDSGLFGDKYRLITNPKTGLESGKGYIVGLDIIPKGDPYYEEMWSSQWEGAKFDDRFTNELLLARDFAPESLAKFVSEDITITDAFSGEAINTEDVHVTLEKGWNFLGNPYTTPIDMSSFLLGSVSPDNWGVSRGSQGTFDMPNKYYILSQGNGSYHPEEVYNKFQYNVTYQIGQMVGETITQEGSDTAIIAPMQLFAVLKNENSDKSEIIIPKSIRTHGDAKYARKSKAQKEPMINELLIETEDLRTGGYDRLCIVFRDEADSKANDIYDAIKIFNNSGGVNQIYTLSSCNKKMLTNVIPLSTEKQIMYFKPAKREQEVLLSAFRMQSLSGVDAVILEDTKTNVFTDLLSNRQYRFMSNPDDTENRFVLHFKAPVSIDDNINELKINMFYNEGQLTIQNLQDADMGSVVSIYDVQGHLMHQEEVNEVPLMQVNKQLGRGVFIVKVKGSRNKIEKILVK